MLGNKALLMNHARRANGFSCLFSSALGPIKTICYLIWLVSRMALLPVGWIRRGLDVRGLSQLKFQKLQKYRDILVDNGLIGLVTAYHFEGCMSLIAKFVDYAESIQSSYDAYT